MSFDFLVSVLKDFQINEPIFSESTLEQKLQAYLMAKDIHVSRQEAVKGIGRNDLVIILDNKKICIELKINTNASVVNQLDRYLEYYNDGVILVCWKSSKTLRTIFQRVKSQIKTPLELIEIKKNQMIV